MSSGHDPKNVSGLPSTKVASAVSQPMRQGLYDPRAEHDACGVGFVVHMKGQRSHDIVRKAMQVLINLEHRGACGCEANTGDGAGILVQMPDSASPQGGVVHAARGGCVRCRVSCFCRAKPRDRDAIRQLFARIVEEEGQTLLGWREVPHDNGLIGDSAQGHSAAVRAGVHRRCRRASADDGVRAEAVRDSEASRARR